jgi:Copper transport outer membrane protein, MctB
VIDFRYHLVSIVAVFLALAIGIVVGSTALKPAVLTTLQKTATAEKKRVDALYAQNRQYQSQLGAAESYAQAGEHLALNGLLDGQRVVLVTAPGFPGGVVTEVTSALTVAGATVTGQVQLQSQFFTAGTQSDLDTLNRQQTPAGVILRPGTPQAQAGELIASAILTKNGPTQLPAGVADATGKSILRGYAAGGFLTISGNPAARATLAVVIIPAAPPATSGPSSASQTLVTMAQQLNLADDATVVAGQLSGSGPGSAIDVMRSGGQADHFSSVDNADTSIGQIVTAQALYEQMTAGKSGSYGALTSASAAGPSPAPTPSPSTTATATATAKQSPGPKHGSKRSAQPDASPSASAR